MSTYTASEICAAAGCIASTLRAWRNRNHLFGDQPAIGGWSRFTLADVIAVRALVLLSQRGFEAQHAVDLINHMGPIFERAAHGGAPLIGIGRKLDSDELEVRGLNKANSVAEELSWFTDPIVLVIDLNAIAFEVAAALKAGGDD
ncbi:MerR family transcriptional regulator [Bosea sp. 117]|uniref:MerR family transcriptional regulator n=1 Tax=Bosea sp. 117 TaxID=1125973 RepID=UPI0004949FD1|nr:MerR family transcriptional regulator [Bosea sp. 117]